MPIHTENIALGNSYSVVHFLTNKDQFEAIADDRGFNKESVFSIIHSDVANAEIALIRGYEYYVMTENGSTYEKLYWNEPKG